MKLKRRKVAELEINKIYNMDCLYGLKLLKDNSIDCCITSPPYWGLRDYGVDGQIGLEDNPYLYVEKMTEVFNEVRRVLKPEGTLWLNLGDSYAGSMKGIGKDGKAYAGEKQKTNKGSVGIYKEKPPPKANEIGLKPKDLIGIPWRVAFALQEYGWYLRSDIIWNKTNCLPESVKDRPTKAHEYIFLMSKSQKYYYDYNAISEPAKYAGDNRGLRKDSRRGTECNSVSGVTGYFKNKRTVWSVTTKPFKEAHFATFPPDLILPCVLAGCPENGIILDPFMGAGTTALVALQNNRNYIGFELNESYCNIANNRVGGIL